MWKNLLSLSSRMMSTIVAKNTATSSMDKVVASQLEKICGDQTHKLYGVAREIVRFQGDAEDILALTREAEKDKELLTMAEKDLGVIQDQIELLKAQFLNDLVDSYRIDPVYSKCSEVLLEVSPGVGGSEAMLFSEELLKLYTNYVEYKQWAYSVVHHDLNEIGGLRHGSILINSPQAYKTLSLESGVHRVQRVPKTEKSGRIHTSTTTVSILPTLDNIDIKVDDKDLKVETKRASGAGGQHVNTTDSAVRITHLPTGIAVDCQTERYQLRNKASAMKMLLSKLYKIESEKSLKLCKDLRKMQIGLGERSDKIRTYNYLQDRVTDHRFSYSTHNVEGLLEGGPVFDDFLSEVKLREVERVLNLL